MPSGADEFPHLWARCCHLYDSVFQNSQIRDSRDSIGTVCEERTGCQAAACARLLCADCLSRLTASWAL